LQDLNVSLIQTALHWCEPATNRTLLDGLIADINHPSDLIILPEMFTTGFTLEPADHAERMDGATLDWMKLIASDFNTTLCGSLIIEDAGHYYNRLIWMRPDGTSAHYDKRHLFSMAGEDDHYTGGQTRLIAELNGWRICPLVCYDLRFPVFSRGINEFDLLIYIANWPTRRLSAWQTLLPARAVENLCYSIGVNRTGTDGNDIDYPGCSMVTDFLGHSLIDNSDKTVTSSIRLDGEALIRYRRKFPAHLDADQFMISDEPKAAN